MATKKKAVTHPKSSKELLDHVKQLAAAVPLEKLSAGLKKVAKARGLTAGKMELRFQAADDPYYNVYRYAFFGKVPELDLEDRKIAVARGTFIATKKGR